MPREDFQNILLRKKMMHKIVYNMIPWSRKWQVVLLPGKSHGQRSLASYSPWSRKESDMTKKLNNDLFLQMTKTLSQKDLYSLKCTWKVKGKVA